MLKQYLPKFEDLEFRRQLMSDEVTMSYNRAWGGTIDFPKSSWSSWYDVWIQNPGNLRFYRYLQNERDEFVGEIAYHSDGKRYMADVIVLARYRGRGYGREGLRLLCAAAKANGIECLYDEIAADNPAIRLFRKLGFAEVERTEATLLLKKTLA